MGHLYIFSEEMSNSDLSPIFLIELSFYYWVMSSLYIPDVSPLCDLQVFLPFCGLSSHLFDGVLRICDLEYIILPKIVRVAFQWIEGKKMKHMCISQW